MSRARQKTSRTQSKGFNSSLRIPSLKRAREHGAINDQRRLAMEISRSMRRASKRRITPGGSQALYIYILGRCATNTPQPRRNKRLPGKLSDHCQSITECSAGRGSTEEAAFLDLSLCAKSPPLGRVVTKFGHRFEGSWVLMTMQGLPAWISRGHPSHSPMRRVRVRVCVGYPITRPNPISTHKSSKIQVWLKKRVSTNGNLHRKAIT